MFSGKPNFSLRNKKIIRRRSISGATTSMYGTSQPGLFSKKSTPPFPAILINGSSTNSSRPPSGSSNRPTDTNSSTTPLSISRPVSASSLAPLLQPHNGGMISIHVDLNVFSEGDNIWSVPVTNDATCKHVLTIVSYFKINKLVNLLYFSTSSLILGKGLAWEGSSGRNDHPWFPFLFIFTRNLECGKSC